MFNQENLKKVTNYIWEIPKNSSQNMRVPARIFASKKLLKDLFKDKSADQLINVATLPGIQKYAIAMPDMHEGYGFPIGGVAAFDLKDGIISPGGIGYDINCGVRIIKTGVKYEEIKEKIGQLATALYHEIPSGVGKGGKFKFSKKELDEILTKGIDKMIELGYATKEDKENCESFGRLPDADPSLVSEHAKDRGQDQLGTIGAGNHFVEVQRVDEIFNIEASKVLDIKKDDITIMIHCGSRGLGHQVATDYIRTMLKAMPKYGIKLPDPELACVPFQSPEGQNYWRAMSAAANFAWANRQLITWEIRQVWQKVFGSSAGSINSLQAVSKVELLGSKAEQAASELSLIYDVAHNIAKIEEYSDKKFVIHRKGATRSFPPGHLEIPKKYKNIGQPVLIPGSMGTASFILVGQKGALDESFGSSCHGAGRVMSRTRAKRKVKGGILREEMEKGGIAVRAGSISGLSEEAPVAYKDVEEVVDVIHQSGLASRVARLKPVAVIKG